MGGPALGPTAILHISVPSLSCAPSRDTVVALRHVYLYSPLLSFVNLPAVRKGHQILQGGDDGAESSSGVSAGL